MLGEAAAVVVHAGRQCLTELAQPIDDRCHALPALEIAALEHLRDLPVVFLPQYFRVAGVAPAGQTVFRNRVNRGQREQFCFSVRARTAVR